MLLSLLLSACASPAALAADGLPVVTLERDQFAPATATDGFGGMYVGWLDRRLGYNVDVFVQNLFDNDEYVSAAQNSLLTSVGGTAAAGLGYINVALPERRVYGLRIGYKF